MEGSFMDKAAIDKRQEYEKIIHSLDKDQKAVIMFIAEHDKATFKEIQKGTGVDAKKLKKILGIN
jgi:DNA-binding MarR family transcriptional regulator